MAYSPLRSIAPRPSKEPYDNVAIASAAWLQPHDVVLCRSDVVSPQSSRHPTPLPPQDEMAQLRAEVDTLRRHLSTEPASPRADQL